MKYSIRTRVSGGEIGSHDTLWDRVEIMPNGWLRAWNAENWSDEYPPGTVVSLELAQQLPEPKITDERWYPPTSIYSVKPITGE